MICRECGLGEEAGPFKHSPTARNRGIHKKCHSAYILGRYKRKKSEKNPHGWMQCHDCDFIFSIYNCGGFTLRTFCPKCQSEEIQTFAEMMGVKKSGA
jgi:RNase P subunit RPR2